MTKKILMIVGSFRKKSFNQQLANRIIEVIGDRAEVSFLDYRNLAFVNQDEEFPPSAELTRIRKEVDGADALWIVTPEYNFSYPGVVKNLMDWLSRPVVAGDYEHTSIGGKLVTISGASGRSAAGGSRKKLTELLGLINAKVMSEQTGISMRGDSFGSDVLHLTPEDEANIKTQVEAFLEFIK